MLIAGTSDMRGVLTLMLALATPAFAVDSTGGLANPSMGTQTVAAGQPCSYPGLIARTDQDGFASCESGQWVTRAISNPTVVNAAYSIEGVAGVGSYAACPQGKKAIMVGCLIYGGYYGDTNSTPENMTPGYFHDESTRASGMTGFLPLAGDQGGYCLMVSTSTGNHGGALVPVAICGDR